MKRLMLYLMTGMCVASATAQNVTYNHDSAKQNQFTVAEIGSGSLTPDLYYTLLHNSYRKTASAKNKLSFLHGYRNVIVVKKLTFPNDKVLTVELTEKQISGRTISVNIDYEDVLSADGFSNALLMEE